MATSTQIILLIACACAVDCRYMRERFRKHPLTIVDQAKTAIKDADAVIFPSDDEESKKGGATITNGQDKPSHIIEADNETKEKEFAPIISKIVPKVEDKEVYINPILTNTEKTTDKIVDEKETSLIAKLDKPADIIESNKVQSNESEGAVATEVNGSEVKVNGTVNLNKTTPDFPSRFGVSGNYMLVPVASYQPTQTNANVVPYGQSNPIPIAPTNSNALAANVAPNIGSNLQYSPNVGSIQYAGPNNGNFNPTLQTNTNTYVPINVPNTYVINGQLYAAVTVPSNAQVPSTLYYVTPQVSGYQVSNNVPSYNLNDGLTPLNSQVNMNANGI